MASQIRNPSLLLLLILFLAGCNRSQPPLTQQEPSQSGQTIPDEFFRLMNEGKNYLDQGDATNAVARYTRAVGLVPADIDVHLNLANAYLAMGAASETIREADEALKLDPNLAAAWFLKGSARLRMSNPEGAVQAFENANKLEPGVTPTLFQLGLARYGLKQWDAAITAFRAGLALEPNRLHSSAHYLLGQALLRAGRAAEAEQELSLHQANVEGEGPGLGAATFERSKYTIARVPFKLDQPEQEGIRVRFVEATQDAFGDRAGDFSGPVGVIDPNRSGWNSLFVFEKNQGFRLLWNTNGFFQPDPTSYPADAGARYSKVLVGDLQNDRFEDIIVLGAPASLLFRFATNGQAFDFSQESRLANLGAKDGALMDLDFTGKLDLVAVTVNSNGSSGVKILRQFGPLLFSDITSTSGIPASLQNAATLAMEDWDRDQIMDLIVSRIPEAPLLLGKQRGGGLEARGVTNWVQGAVFCTGDFDNDLRPDVAIASGVKITICFNSGARREIAVSGNPAFRELTAFDHDNDGWLDLWAAGANLRVWRNLGFAGFQEQTAQLGADKVEQPVSALHFADFDLDCDSDLILALEGGGLRYLRNEGGNVNNQIKVQLIGNRSNASGLGCKVEIQTGGLRLLRTVQRFPVEIGVGKHQTLDSFLVHWFNWPQGAPGIPVNCREPLFALELTIQEGSCPYVYVWDGKGFRFVTDILGAAPLGLPLAEGRYVEADPEEYVWLGTEETFQPRHGFYELQITEELREVLYLDEARLVIVDRAPGAEVHPTDKLLPGKPFPSGQIMTLHREHPLQRAQTLQEVDVTSALRTVDNHRVSPPKLRASHLRGLAEPHGLLLDFGLLDLSQPLVLVLNGWLRFGGGMANIAASHDTSLPFPFPVLEGELPDGTWKNVDVTVGAPAGKTKTILVDLTGKLPPDTRRLRLKHAFEIHWDRITMLEKKTDALTQIHSLVPDKADLHFRGFSAIRHLPPDWPLTPDYDTVSANSYWTVTPGGWCTRYGDVRELIVARDEALALLNSGDELTLKFAVNSLPPKPPGTHREFFLYVDGWDKDSDFHVAAGTEVGPLPFHGMNDQLYGRESRPQFPSDSLNQRYNNRWVEGRVLKQAINR